MKLFDVHTHVQFAAFKDDKEEVIRRALDSGILMINIGTQRDTSQTAIDLAKKYETGVWATVGLHPIHTLKSFHDEQEIGGSGAFESREETFDYEFYRNLAQEPKVVAIGECGLDYYRLDEGTKKKQEKVFVKHIELSRDIKKPLMIHCREAFSDLINILFSYRSSLADKPGVVHFFSGSKEDAAKLMDLGFSFSFGGVITFAREYEKLISYIPLDRILLETDAPYVAPVPCRGKRNEPSHVIEVAKKIAELKEISLEEIAETTFKNAEAIFLEKNLEK
ncbi:hypothetical protein A2Z63_02000 [Candidatus Giovannonibacteria bacterium RIFCSPLOWO2_02_44_8]|uniref:Hydrolase TatD n=1 Tax=Candidatus Giovannonibacteria bacterium RIFCSPLOWO2_02_44_8 TaxID=1798355 RepID=A0A1F5XCE3_9BACT|nr:MAG: hypothetical protein A2Z63_02000 [Candidatus Giovannonibacteria bacterium RIFCSPLOWO2_02_44_8]